MKRISGSLPKNPDTIVELLAGRAGKSYRIVATRPGLNKRSVNPKIN